MKKTFTRQDFVNWGKKGPKAVLKKHGKNPVDFRNFKAKKLSTVSTDNRLQDIKGGL